MARTSLRVTAAVVVLATLAASTASPAPPRPRPDEFPKAPLSRTQSFDLGQRIDANQVSMVVSNVGSFAFDLVNGAPGLEFPRGSGLTAAFAGGLWLGAQVGFDARVTVAEYSQEYGPGRVVNGQPDDPMDPRYRVYKLRRVYASAAERNAALQDYLTNAVPTGAPPVAVLPDGTLGIVGDQMLWCVYNDADPLLHFSLAGGTAPLGIEVQQTVFAFDRPGPLGRTVFLRYRIVNKGTDNLEGFRISLWMDPDIGDAFDDLVGCVPARDLAYCYNAGPDQLYGATPAAVLAKVIQGPSIPEGGRFGLTAFTSYVNGTDPAASFESYNYMDGYLADGSQIIDPILQTPTQFMHSGDPLAGKGWLDATATDKRFNLSSNALALAPGEEQEVVYALHLGRQGSDLGALAQVLCEEPAITVFAAAGFQGPDPVSAPCPLPPSCPLTADEWEQRFDAAQNFDLTLIAQCIDERSTFLSIMQNPEESVRQLLDAGNLATPAGAAVREYVALLANACAAQYGYPSESPIVLRPATPVSCPGLEATSVRELLDPAVLQVDGLYLNHNTEHSRALDPVNWGGVGFGGGVGPMSSFLGNGPDPFDQPEFFPRVELHFDPAHPQLAYRYLRLEVADTGAPPPAGREYRFGGFRSVPFACWDVTHGVQLDVAFVERAFTDGDGTLLPGEQQPATFDSTWAPSAEEIGGREYLIVVHRPYTGSPAPDLAVDDAIRTVQSTFSYALWSRLRSELAVIDPGDAFRFTFEYEPSLGVDSELIQLAALPPPDAAAAHTNIAGCLHGLNGQLSCCDDHQAPTLSVTMAPADLWPPNHEVIAIRAQATAQDNCDAAPQISLVSITSDEPDAGTGPEDLPGDIQDAQPGTGDFDFRLRSERADGGDGRVYMVCYQARDANGNTVQTCATVKVPHDRRGRANLAAGQDGWKLTIYGSRLMDVRTVETSSIAVGTDHHQVGAGAAPPSYADVDRDRFEDLVVTLAPGLTPGEAAEEAFAARWTAGGEGYWADLEGAVTGVPGTLPLAFEAGARPNPARAEAAIHFAVPREGHVRVRVFDLSGREVARLLDRRVPGGRHSVAFRPGAAQLYLYRVEWEGKVRSGRLAILR